MLNRTLIGDLGRRAREAFCWLATVVMVAAIAIIVMALWATMSEWPRY